jgi:hypothetical protein
VVVVGGVGWVKVVSRDYPACRVACLVWWLLPRPAGRRRRKDPATARRCVHLPPGTTVASERESVETERRGKKLAGYW